MDAKRKEEHERVMEQQDDEGTTTNKLGIIILSGRASQDSRLEAQGSRLKAREPTNAARILIDIN